MDSEGANLFGRSRRCWCTWDLSLSGRAARTKRRPLGRNNLKPQADLVGGRQLSRDLWLLPTGIYRRPGWQAYA
jgi:hypothetical protein